MSALRDELDRIRQQQGEVYPRLAYQMVEGDRAAWPALDRLIGQDWDDAVAGPKWRIEKIRHAMGRVYGVEYVKGSVSELRSYIAVPSPGRQAMTWMPTMEVIEDPVLLKLALEEMRRRIEDLTNRYQAYEQFVPMLLTAVREMRRRSRKAQPV